MLGGIFVALLIAEAGVRVILPPPLKPRVTVPAGISPLADAKLGFTVYKPGVAFSHVYDVSRGAGHLGPDGRVDYRISSRGFRGVDVPDEVPPGVRRILCLGDSFTFGEGVRENDAWPLQLERLLPGTQVINAGIQGSDLDREGLLLFLYGRRFKPAVVVIGFFMNDAMPFGRTVEHRALLTEPADDLSWLARRSALWGFFERRRIAAERTARYLEELRDSFNGDRWKAMSARIPRFREMADHDGFTILTVVFPLLYKLGDDYPLQREQAAVVKAFRDAGIETIDLRESYRAYDAEALWVHPLDPHPNPLAHRIAAEQVARALSNRAR